MMVYMFTAQPQTEERPRLFEIAAPDCFTASAILASQHPGIHIMRFEGSYPEWSKGEA